MSDRYLVRGGRTRFCVYDHRTGEVAVIAMAFGLGSDIVVLALVTYVIAEFATGLFEPASRSARMIVPGIAPM